MTKKALAKLNKKQLTRVEDYRAKRHCGVREVEKEAAQNVIGYLAGLVDSGIITDRERMMIYIYTTI